MDRRQFLAGTAVVAAVTAGCTTRAQNDEPDAMGTVRGAAPEDPAEREIEVSARGEVETEPDRATLSVSVEATGDSADAVESDLAEQAAALRDAFDDLEIPDDDVESGRYDVRPERNGTGYRGRHQFRLTLRDPDRVGDVIDTITAAGADDVGRINFGLTDQTRAALRDSALEEALENADAEARSIAADRNVTITGTKAVSTRNVDVVPVRAEYDAATAEVADDADASPRTEIDSGPVTVTASVDVVYGFE
ncbi:SIMPL domain-containing protein [Natrarchaeobaculum aegyptiacum]|uniref:SIMPL domain-containing protein n=1 Tax=Natrarchaeobaculum aegyptiacum TaxID=745377 RepID=A0A2Z2HTV6_9EURY|nr:SIMPL domain-containing protein [Natrarchaeobaculum aegyptiacum]ARS90640.1 hypothetical protein B1756_13495 [Natrarchaeobaculum aegyptiacum]